jgi:hypothetical protein
MKLPGPSSCSTLRLTSDQTTQSHWILPSGPTLNRVSGRHEAPAKTLQCRLLTTITHGKKTQGAVDTAHKAHSRGRVPKIGQTRRIEVRAHPQALLMYYRAAHD